MDYHTLTNEELAAEWARVMEVPSKEALAHIESSDKARRQVADLLTARSESEQAIAKSRDAVERFRAALS